MLIGAIAAQGAATQSIWTPAELASPPSIWLDDSSGVTTVSGLASAWSDKSGNSYHFTQSTAGSRPQILVANINGRDALRFDTDSLICDITAAKNLTASTAALWVLSVSKKRADSALAALFSSPRSGATPGVRLGVYTSLSGSVSRGGVGGRRVDGDSFGSYIMASSLSNDWHVRLDALDYGGRSAATWVNGQLHGQSTGLWSASGVSSSTMPGGPLAIGASYSASGFSAEAFDNSDVAAVLFGNGAVPSAADIDRLFGWAAWRYGLETLLPPGHPYYGSPP